LHRAGVAAYLAAYGLAGRGVEAGETSVLSAFGPCGEGNGARRGVMPGGAVPLGYGLPIAALDVRRNPPDGEPHAVVTDRREVAIPGQPEDAPAQEDADR
jgi:hypothetical protein